MKRLALLLMLAMTQGAIAQNNSYAGPGGGEVSVYWNTQHQAWAIECWGWWDESQPAGQAWISFWDDARECHIGMVMIQINPNDGTWYDNFLIPGGPGMYDGYNVTIDHNIYRILNGQPVHQKNIRTYGNLQFDG